WDDPFIAEKLCSEAEGIFLWALEGLKRLIQNGYHFTKSERTQANIEASMREGNNILDFMDSEGYFLFKADDWITSKDFYEVYVMWCDDNAEKPLVRKTFINYLRSKEQKYNLEYNNYGHNREGRRVWGFLGIRNLVKIF
ncbi:MAG: DNA primase, partial [Oscillospiraceae bacterium]